MGLQKYIIFSIFYILSISGVVYYQTQSLYLVNIMDFEVNMHIALWAIAPIVLFFILSLMHILIYGFKNYIKDKNGKKDIEKLTKHLNAIILNKTCDEVFSNKSLRDIADFFKYLNFEYDLDKKYSTNIDILHGTLQNIKQIKEGSYINKLEKTLNIEKTNPLSILNIFNNFTTDTKFYLNVLKNQSTYNKDIIEYAFITAIEHENFTIVKNEITDISISEQAVIKLFKLYENENNILVQDDYLFILKKAELSKEQYINLVKIIKTFIEPNELILFFDKVCDKYENSIKAYIYLLLDLEMIDKAKELLESVDTQDGEYDKFRTYLNIKDSGTQCNISDFI